jgi:hypothetical protein
MAEFIVWMGLWLGLAGWVLALYTIIKSLFSDPRWRIIIDHNHYGEGMIELVLFTSICIFIFISALYYVMS